MSIGRGISAQGTVLDAVAELGGECRTGSTEPGLDGADRHPHRFGDVGDRGVGEVVQDDGLTLPGRERPQRAE
jgi:hypothetical protein